MSTSEASWKRSVRDTAISWQVTMLLAEEAMVKKATRNHSSINSSVPPHYLPTFNAALICCSLGYRPTSALTYYTHLISSSAEKLIIMENKPGTKLLPTRNAWMDLNCLGNRYARSTLPGNDTFPVAVWLFTECFPPTRKICCYKAYKYRSSISTYLLWWCLETWLGLVKSLAAVLPQHGDQNQSTLKKQLTWQSRKGECIFNSRIWQSFAKKNSLGWGVVLWSSMHLRVARDQKHTSIKEKRASSFTLPLPSLAEQFSENIYQITAKMKYTKESTD